MGQNTISLPIEDATRRIDDLKVQKQILERETAVGEQLRRERLGVIEEQLVAWEANLAKLKSQWEKEIELVRRIAIRNSTQ